jgi:hypothetical protein
MYWFYLSGLQCLLQTLLAMHKARYFFRQALLCRVGDVAGICHGGFQLPDLRQWKEREHLEELDDISIRCVEQVLVELVGGQHRTGQPNGTPRGLAKLAPFGIHLHTPGLS